MTYCKKLVLKCGLQFSSFPKFYVIIFPTIYSSRLIISPSRWHWLQETPDQSAQQFPTSSSWAQHINYMVTFSQSFADCQDWGSTSPVTWLVGRKFPEQNESSGRRKGGNRCGTRSQPHDTCLLLLIDSVSRAKCLGWLLEVCFTGP